ncbi:hypothetical protein L3Q82_013877 [Scortum barcoo]|uniref:Uncharacterized protein n=1 Tax=Scortum barcoo TaxID=214431 RepID=A0ACB8VY44_9TELE|nr:hypothetical protein L3Q82_013877 [Scortum barcoo]
MEKMARPLPINPTFLPPTHGVLKSLLENPLKLPFHHDEGFGKEKEKEKKLDDESGAANHPQSAFLGPTLWDKTLPYDGDNFQLEYMDLEEFLSENGIPANTAQSGQATQATQPAQQAPPPSTPTPPTASVVDLSSRATTSVHTAMAPQTCLRSPSSAGRRSHAAEPDVHLGDTHTCAQRHEEVAAVGPRVAPRSAAPSPPDSSTTLIANARSINICWRHEPEMRVSREKVLFSWYFPHFSAGLSFTSSALSPRHPQPHRPRVHQVQVPLTYEPDPADLALSSVPGQEMFDPRKRKFSAEELKPQPMIKKARKVFIPEDLKDDKYWARRRKNNVAAKRSRDARRLKENQIAIRAGFLEKENAALRIEVADMRKELGRCKNILAKYEARHGPL